MAATMCFRISTSAFAQTCDRSFRNSGKKTTQSGTTVTILDAAKEIPQEYVSPPENSKYNSREYRTKLFEERGTWQQSRDVTRVNQIGKITKSTETKTGTYKKPTKYANYQVDSYHNA